MDWGTAPAWIGSVGTGLSLVLAFSIILRDRARERAAQAAKIACWEKRPITHHVRDGAVAHLSVENHDVWMHNASALPITDSGVICRTLTKREAKRRYSAQELAAFEKPPENTAYFMAGSSLEIDEGSNGAGVVMPGETATKSLLKPLDERAANPYVRAWISFRDVSGTGWFRDLETGRLLRARHWSTQIRLAGGPHYFLRRYWGPRRQAYRYWLRSG